MNMTET